MQLITKVYIFVFHHWHSNCCDNDPHQYFHTVSSFDNEVSCSTSWLLISISSFFYSEKKGSLQFSIAYCVFFEFENLWMEQCSAVNANIVSYDYNWSFAKHRPWTQTGQSERSICQLDRGLTTPGLGTIEPHAAFSDFHHCQACFVNFKLSVVKHCVWGTFKGDAYY